MRDGGMNGPVLGTLIRYNIPATPLGRHIVMSQARCRGDVKWGALVKPKLPQCLFIVSYVVGIDTVTVVKRHQSQ